MVQEVYDWKLIRERILISVATKRDVIWRG